MTSHRNPSDGVTVPPATSETPTQADATHPAALTDSNTNPTHPSSEGGGARDNPGFAADGSE